MTPWRKTFRLLLIFLLFILSLGIPSVVAKVSAQPPSVQSLYPALQLVKEGRTLYEGGRFAEAAEVWKQAISAFATQNDKLNQAMALSNLSLTYQQLGKLPDADKAITEGLQLLKTERSTKEQLRILAQSLDIQGQLQLMKGESEAALQMWQQAAENYSQIGDKFAIVQNEINQAQAMQALGLYSQAVKRLTEVKKFLEEPFFQTQDRATLQLKATGLRSLGNALRIFGNLDLSKSILQQSLNVAKESQYIEDIIAAELSLADTDRSIANRSRNLLDDPIITTIIDTKNYQEAVENLYSLAFDGYRNITNSEATPIAKIQAELNHLSLLLDIKRWWVEQINKRQMTWPELELQLTQKALFLWSKIESQINNLSASRAAVFARINLAQSLVCLTQTKAKAEYSSPIAQSCPFSDEKVEDERKIWQLENVPTWQQISQILATAVRESRALNDVRSQAYALGYLGGIYQQNQDYENAEFLTKKALKLTADIDAPNIDYLWQWQLGRLRKAKGDEKGAIAAYTTAFDTLKSLRKDLVSISRDVQFNFRDSVEPFYRELVELLLKEAQPSQTNLKLAREAIEALQLAELDDYFRSACVSGRPELIDRVVDEDKAESKAAVIYPIILNKKMAVIAKLPKKDLLYYSASIGKKEIESILQKLWQELKLPSPSAKGKELSKQIYNWLIQPIETDLMASQVKTLVFVLDGKLRNIPMAALFDGKEYLMQKYGIALAPGLQLISPKPLSRQYLNVLGAGVSMEQELMEGVKYTSLPNVKIELELIKEKLSSEILLNQNFTDAKFKQQIGSDKFSVVHIATHGQFSSNPDQTYIVIWGKRLKVTELDNILRVSDRVNSKPIELLLLTACETAKGDERATLGIAGVAVRAGARSTLASLWRADDKTTVVLIDEFYQQLKNNPRLPKTEALRLAQQKLLKDNPATPPSKWAPYILLGNWQ
ncbi:CHAT domain-containing protein [Argonema antarcticum]|uniref:CHAT domain-containing protein n=1 Tax=Argonema antarcticum TaxID=2942763 RepID=UPI00201360F8|nr:CHAT domain-containing protein [Argonema antarcticum]MCL1471931.1 CHAT domain-containing protein [Argonema antarcticum A004/B2]